MTTTSRCYDHKNSKTLPLACPTCMRIYVEHRIVKKTVKALLAAGYKLQTDLNEDPRPAKPTASSTDILAEMAETDDEFLGVFSDAVVDVDGHDERPAGWVRFVYGNSGYDVISDYTTNLEEVLAPVKAYAETLEGSRR